MGQELGELSAAKLPSRSGAARNAVEHQDRPSSFALRPVQVGEDCRDVSCVVTDGKRLKGVATVPRAPWVVGIAFAGPCSSDTAYGEKIMEAPALLVGRAGAKIGDIAWVRKQADAVVTYETVEASLNRRQLGCRVSAW